MEWLQRGWPRVAQGPYVGRAIRYETDQTGKVRTAYAGRPSATEFVEGCL